MRSAQKNLLNPYLDLFEALSELSPEILKKIRRKVIWSYAWAIPHLDAIQTLCSLGPLIEIGAGSGYWAWMIRQSGGNILALDQNAPAPPLWTEVLRGDATQLSEFPDRSLLLCWPPDKSSMASDCLKRYSGKTVAYIGEEKGGNTGDSRFFEILTTDFELRSQIQIPRWPGCQDSLFIFDRKHATHGH